MAKVGDIGAAREREIEDFVAGMERAGFSESDCDLADVIVHAFLKHADVGGWRLDSYLVGDDYKNQMNKGEK